MYKTPGKIGLPGAEKYRSNWKKVLDISCALGIIIPVLDT